MSEVSQLHNSQPTQGRQASILLTLSLHTQSVLLRGLFFDDFLTMSIHPEYEFVACSNDLEVVCSGSNFEWVKNHLETEPSAQMLAAESTMRLAGNTNFRPFFSRKGPRLVFPRGYVFLGENQKIQKERRLRRPSRPQEKVIMQSVSDQSVLGLTIIA